MRLLKNIQRLTLSTIFILALSACSSKDNSDANTTAQGGAMQDASTASGTGAGNEANLTRNVEVVNTAPALTSLTLESNATTLNVDDTVQLTLKGTYSDGSSGTVEENITYTLHPTDNAEVNGSVLKAKKDGNVTVQATIDGVNSNTITLNITWVVNGHVLPPEPDKTLNDSTLLGIDVNDNGVRDDVERIIYKTYQNKHPIHIDIGMQAARGYKLVLESPERAKEIHGRATAYLDCESYYKTYAKYFNEPILIKENVIGEYFRKKIYFNTKDRMDTYEQYDTLLSGDTYSLPKIKDLKSLCDFNSSKYEE